MKQELNVWNTTHMKNKRRINFTKKYISLKNLAKENKKDKTIKPNNIYGSSDLF